MIISEFKQKKTIKHFLGIRNVKREIKNEFKPKKKTKVIRNIIKQTGGNDKTTVPPYQNIKNDPFKTNDERTTFNKRKEDNIDPKMPPVMLEQKIYDTRVQKPSPPPPPYIPLYENDRLTLNNMYQPYVNTQQQPIQKTYNISLSNPLHDFSTVSTLYEDIIPGDPRSFTFTTTYERIELIRFIRNIINNNNDGESMNVSGGKNTLLSSIKLLTLNPYSLNTHPYKDLGNNFLIYKAAYPVRYNKDQNIVSASKSNLSKLLFKLFAIISASEILYILTFIPCADFDADTIFWSLLYLTG